MKKLFKPSVIPAILWASILALLMLLPSDSFPESKLFSYDKIAHIGVFFILATLVGWASIATKKRILLTKKELMIILIITLLYSSTLEFLQQLVPGRMTDLYDFIANSVGGLLGVIVFSIFTRKKFAKLKLML